MRIVKEKKKIDGNKVVNRIGIGMIVVGLALLPVSITSYVNKKSNEEELTSATKIEAVEPEIRYVDDSEVYMIPKGYSLNGEKIVPTTKVQVVINPIIKYRDGSKVYRAPVGYSFKEDCSDYAVKEYKR